MMTPEQAAAFVFAQASLMNAEIATLEANDRSSPDSQYGEIPYAEIYARYEPVIGHNGTIGLFNQANET